MIRSAFSYNAITFRPFVRTSGYVAEMVSGDQVGIRDTITSIPGADGVERYKSFYRDRLIEIRGFVMGTSESNLYTLINALESAFDIHNLEALFEDGFAPLEFTDPGQNAGRYYCKPIKQTLRVDDKKTGYARGFSILLEAKDPKKYMADVNTFTIVPTISGGSSALPAAVPFAVGGTNLSGSTTINNTGQFGLLPKSIVINGPVSAPKIENTTTGQTLEFTTDLVLVAGEQLVITPSLGTCMKVAANGSQESVIEYLTSTSKFWTLDSGNNNINFSGATMNTGCQAQITVQFSFS